LFTITASGWKARHPVSTIKARAAIRSSPVTVSRLFFILECAPSEALLKLLVCSAAKVGLTAPTLPASTGPGLESIDFSAPEI
jgi:hypothetical protein